MHLEILIEFLLFCDCSRNFYEKRISAECSAECLGEEWKVSGLQTLLRWFSLFLIVQSFLMVESGLIVKNITSHVSKVITKVLECLQSNRENCKHQKYFWNVIVLQEKSQSGMRKLNCKQEY